MVLGSRVRKIVLCTENNIFARSLGWCLYDPVCMMSNLCSVARRLQISMKFEFTCDFLLIVDDDGVGDVADGGGVSVCLSVSGGRAAARHR